MPRQNPASEQSTQTATSRPSLNGFLLSQILNAHNLSSKSFWLCLIALREFILGELRPRPP